MRCKEMENVVTNNMHRFISMELHRKGLIPCLLHLLLLFASISLQHCNAVNTISVTEPLQDPSFLVSSGQIFKLGFFSLENTSNRYVGIMFNVPNMSVLWVANRDRPLRDSSGVLTISEDGNLVVLNGMKEILWSSNVSNPATNSTAQLLEDGNLVLRDNSNGRNVWEGFQNPTDTFWPGLRIGGNENHNIQITSWRSPSDPSVGNFTFGLNPLRTPEMFVWNRGVVYWRSGPWNGNIFIGVPEMSPVYGSRTTMVTDNSGGTYFTYNIMNNTRLLHYSISDSGVFHESAINDQGDWEVTFPKERSECDVYAKCGPNGICDPRRSPICLCLRGFDPRDRAEWMKGNWSGGCARRAPLQCQRNNSAGQQGEGDGYLKLTNAKVPDFYSIITFNEVNCGDECLKNCSCSAYTFVVGIGCLQWVDNLVDIQQFSTRGSDLYLHVAHSELDSGGSKQKRNVIIASTIVVVGCLLLAASLYIFWNMRRKQQVGAGEESNIEVMVNGSLGIPKLEDLPMYSYETIANATDDFHDKNKLGQGGFGAVYKGKLLDGQEIAVKRLSNSSTQGIKEFMNEVTVISKLQHRNLVRIIGCCVERGEKMLVYEYMPNKSLDAYLFDSLRQNFLDWNSRLVIIEGISRGLLYLHRDSRLLIIHRDLKASNILLDEELNPKISDFGLAKIFGGKQDQENTNRIVGTYGYMAPEYAMGGKVSEKSDVYSFGVLLLEIVSGMRNSSFYPDEEDPSLLRYAWKLWNENEVANLAFTETQNPSVETEIKRCVQVGLLCVQDSPNDRPNMSNVLLMLNSEIMDLPLPKPPVYTATFSLSEGQSNQQNGYSNNDVSLTEFRAR